MNPLTTTMLGYYRPEYDSFTLSTLMNSNTTALYCCGNSILRDTLLVLQRLFIYSICISSVWIHKSFVNIHLQLATQNFPLDNLSLGFLLSLHSLVFFYY